MGPGETRDTRMRRYRALFIVQGAIVALLFLSALALPDGPLKVGALVALVVLYVAVRVYGVQLKRRIARDG